MLAATVLWCGLLVCLLHGFSAQLDLWRLLTQWGLWHFPRVDVSDMAVYKRLERTSPAALRALFDQVSAAASTQLTRRSVTEYAPFATEILALDQTVLDPVLRHKQVLRGLKAGDHALIPGVLNGLFDVRKQQWRRIEFRAEPMQNEKATAPEMLAALPKGTLLLFDLGYFSFPWFDLLTQRGDYYVSRQRKRVSSQVLHVFYDRTSHAHGNTPAVHLRDALIYLGAHAGDRAAYPVRLIEVTVGESTYRYLTNVLDPRLLPAWQVVELYRMRWDIEKALDLLKRHLGLHLLFSAHQNVVLQQVYATLIIAQVILALRTEIAGRANASVREVSLELLVRWLPRLAAMGLDPVAEFVAKGRAAGFIRPFRGRAYPVPHVTPDQYDLPERLPPRRPARYSGAAENPAHLELLQQLNALPPDPGEVLA